MSTEYLVTLDMSPYLILIVVFPQIVLWLPG
jgi:hypothetical protein